MYISVINGSTESPTHLKVRFISNVWIAKLANGQITIRTLQNVYFISRMRDLCKMRFVCHTTEAGHSNMTLKWTLSISVLAEGWTQ